MKRILNLVVLVVLAAGLGACDSKKAEWVPPDVVDSEPDADPAIVDDRHQCSPVDRFPCRENERCTWLTVDVDDPATIAMESTVGLLQCVPLGSLPIGSSCVASGPAYPNATPPIAGTGSRQPDDCVSGAYCGAAIDGQGTCLPLCMLDDDTCEVGTNCQVIPGTFLSMGISFAGVCEPTATPMPAQP